MKEKATPEDPIEDDQFSIFQTKIENVTENIKKDKEEINTTEPPQQEDSIKPASIAKLSLNLERKYDKMENDSEQIVLKSTYIKVDKDDSINDDINIEDIQIEYKNQHNIQYKDDINNKECIYETCFSPRYTWYDIKNYLEERKKIDIKLGDKKWNCKKYPFNLDPFQKLSIDCIEHSENVLVAAHTSAGKTAVAEYAIAKSLEQTQRVIYTTPIKALSNQKYNELQKEFNDVGLMTGDTTINSSASCLVMTTEILRNMLYHGSEILHEVSWVLFDEIHYMKDRTRGVVWEETIILLPNTVHMVFLSATISNAQEFAKWISKIHDTVCTVVYTEFRPTPLQHYIYPYNGSGMYCVFDSKRIFREKNYEIVLQEQDGIKSSNTNKRQRIDGIKNSNNTDDNTTNSGINSLIHTIQDKHLDPCIIFSFSKRECEEYATQIDQDFCSSKEKKIIDTIFINAISILKDEDRILPQIQNLLPYQKRGIGIHHSGQLPQLKEMIEILFQEGLIRILFSTETFSMGLNMPARTVVFTSIYKYDGLLHRSLNSGEYIQMSGRAGRRGLDDHGTIIVLLDSIPQNRNLIKDIITGSSNPLRSSFYINYSMQLNLLRVDSIEPEYILQKSFFQFQKQLSIPLQYTLVNILKDLLHTNDDTIDILIRKDNINNITKRQDIMNILQQKEEYDIASYKQRHIVNDSMQSLQVNGRIVRIKGVLINKNVNINKYQLPSSYVKEIQYNEYKNNYNSIDILDKKLHEQELFEDELKQQILYIGSQKDTIKRNQKYKQKININSFNNNTNNVNKLLNNDIQQNCYREDIDWGYGIVINNDKKINMPTSCIVTKQESEYGIYDSIKTLLVLVPISNKSQDKDIYESLQSQPAHSCIIPNILKPGNMKLQDTLQLPIMVSYSSIETIYGERLKQPIKNSILLNRSQQQTIQQQYQEQQRRKNTQQTELSNTMQQDQYKRVKQINNNNNQITECQIQISRNNEIQLRIKEHDKYLSNSINTNDKIQYEKLSIQRVQEHQIRQWEQAYSELKFDKEQKATQENMKKVQSKQKQTDNGVITSKGRVACEISSCDEQIAAELLYTDTFSEIDSPTLCALLSCIVCDEPYEIGYEQKQPKNFKEQYEKQQYLVRSIGNVIIDCNQPQSQDKYIGCCNPQNMEMVYAWCQGVSFSKIMTMTTSYEGNVVRMMRRIGEVLQQLQEAASIIGNDELKSRFQDASSVIKRDIVFAGSLYL